MLLRSHRLTTSRPGRRGVPSERLPWRITNVLLRVDSVDASRTVTASAFGSVLGGVKAGSCCCRHRQHGHASRRGKSPGATNEEPTHLRCLNGWVHPGRDVGDVVTEMPEQVSQVRVHVARALVGIAAFVLNVAGLFTPNCHGD
jgi:hypothetical protein